MAQTYLLPCPACERKLPVEATQAGAKLQCECGNALVAPAFRDIKQLEPATAAPAAPKASKWNRTQGVMFSLGILALLVALLLGYFPVTWRSQISMEPPPPPDFTNMNRMVDDWTAAETLEAWEELLAAGVNRSGPPVHVAMRQVATRLNILIGVAVAVGLLGLGSAVGSFFVGRKQ